MPHLHFKRHYKLLLALVIVFAALTITAGSQPIVAYSLPDTGQVAASIVSYGHTLAVLLNVDADGTSIPGSVQMSIAGSAQ